jgi:hypothetical protein
LDSASSELELREISQHLSACRTCTVQSEKYRRLRESLRALPQQIPPPDLALRLRVAASKAAAGATAWHSRRDRFQLFLSDLMRPLALPTMGGLCSAILLFAILVPTFKSAFALNKNPWDVPTMLSTEPTVKFMSPVAFFDGDAVVDLQLDGQGHITNYSIVSAPGKTSEQVRRSIENSLLFTEFWPATTFGRPIAGTIRISFRSSHIDVRG